MIPISPLAFLFVAVTIRATAQAPAPQNSAADPAKAGFETASITPNTSGLSERGATRFQPKGGLHATNVTLVELIKFAQQRHFFDERDVTGGPAWTASERFDLFARVSGEHAFDSDGFPRGCVPVAVEEALWRNAPAGG